jgi:hypothetical protein
MTLHEFKSEKPKYYLYRHMYYENELIQLSTKQLFSALITVPEKRLS